MASEIRIGLNVSSNGTTEAETRRAKALKAAYDDAARSASGIGGGTAGSRAAAAMATRGSAGSGSNQEYGQQRGVAGVTGASARDFANQAQGLGGLVRVYATFAANLFAVSAAFNALREAAQTQQLIRGLDQLGAQSGRALGALSKELVNATGGAISLREAMTAVAQASSAGLANEQIKQLAIVANQASQALGLNMSDALNRLSRGISKIEPELLDELGIFVRVDTAVQNYALAVGKSATSLSEFERRQAFANAVLEQGQKKFGAIAAEANPFDKLLASVKDLGLNALTLLNKVLEPIVRLLAESPSALIAVFATIGGLLLKQALPALGEFRAGLRASAEDAANAAKAFKDSFGDAFQGALEARFDIPKLERELARAETAFRKATQPTTLSAATTKNIAGLSGDQAEATRAAALLNETLARKTKLVETGMKGRRQASEAEIIAAKQEIQYINLAIQAYQKKNQVMSARSQIQGVADITPGPIDPEVVAARTYANLQGRVDRSTAVANAAAAANVVGVRGAFALLNKEIEEKGIKGFDKFTTQVRGGAAAIISRISGIVGAFFNIGAVIATLAPIYAAFDSAASQATKEQEEFNNTLKQVTDNVEAANKTVEEYTRRSKEGFSSQGVIALSTALAGISTNLDTQLASLQKWEAASGVWDRIKDKIAGAFGKSNLDQVRKNTVSTVEAIVKTLQFTSQGGDAKRRLADSLGINTEALGNVKELTSAIQNLDQQQLAGLSDQIKGISEDLTKATQSVQAFKESLQSSGKALNQIAQSTQFSDLQGKLGVELLQSADKLANVLKDDLLGALTAIADLSKNPEALTAMGFSTEEINQLSQAAKIQAQINSTQQAIVASEEKLTKIRKERKTTRDADQIGASPEELTSTAQRVVTALEAADNAAEDAQEGIIRRNKQLLDRLKGEAEKFAETQAGLVEKIAEAGLKRVQIALKGAVEKARLLVQEFRVGEQRAAGLNVAAQEREIALARIRIEREQAVAAFEAQKAVEANTDAVTANTASITALVLEQQRQRERELKGASFTESDNRRFDELIARQLKIAATASTKIQLREGVRPERLKGTLVPDARSGGLIDVTADAQRQLGREQQARAAQLRAATAGFDAQADIANRKAVSDELRYQEKLQQDLASLETERAKIAKDILQTFVGFTQQNTLAENAAQQLAQQEEIRKDAAQQLLRIDQQESEIRRTSTPATQASAREQLNRLNQQKLIVESTRDLRLLQTDLDRLTKDQVTTTNNIVTKQAELNAKREQELSLNQNIRKISREYLDSRLQLGNISQSFLVTLKTQRDLEDETLRFQEERRKLLQDIELKEKAVTDARAKRQAVMAAAERATMDEGPLPPGLLEAGLAATDAVRNAETQLNLQKGALATAIAINQQNVDQITNIGLLNEKLAITKDLLSTMQGLGESLTAVFGDFGTKLGSLVSTIGSVIQKNQEISIATQAQIGKLNDALKVNAKEQAALLDSGAEGSQELVDERIKLERQKTSAIRQADIAEVQGTAKVLGATKSLFKEKTAAYRIFSALEKAAHVVSIGLQLKELATKLFVDQTTTASKVGAEGAQTGATQAGFLARSGTYIAEIYAKTIGQLGPIAGPVVATALVAAIFGSIARGPKKLPTGITAAERQEVQGTGQTYMNGQLVRREGGVLGNDKEVADSITSSIDTLKQEFYGLMGSGSSRIVRALEDINKNTGNTVKVLLAELSVTAPNAKVPGFMGPSTGSSTTNAINTIGVIGGAVGGGMLGASLGAKLGAAFGPVGMIAGAVLGAVFGSMLSSTKTSIIDEGIRVGGNLSGLSQGQGSFEQYQTAKIDTRFLFLKDSKIVPQTAPLSTAATKAIADTFASFQEVLIASAIALEGPATAAIERIKAAQVKLEVSLQGLSGEEAAKAIAAELSVQLNRVTAEIFPYIEQFRQIGEEYFETIARIVKDSEVLVMGLELVGISLGKFNTTEQRLRFEQDFINNLLGGAEAAAKKFESYYETFLTPQEKFRVRFNMLTKVFADANRTLPQTKDEFIKLFTSLDIRNNIEDQKTFALLLNNTENFNELLSLQEEIIGQNKVNLEDLKKSLLDFRSSLLLGATSVLSPTERYALAKKEFENTVTRAIVDKDPEALKQLQNSSQTFLNLSRELYASGSQYVSDFNSVLKALDDATAITSSQINLAAEQLKVTNEQLGALRNIERLLEESNELRTIPTTPEDRRTTQSVTGGLDLGNVPSYVTTIDIGGQKFMRDASTGLWSIQPKAFGGYLGGGLALLGEMGPELVDFQTPGRVYTAEQTRGMFTPNFGNNGFQQMVAKLQEVQGELNQLRKEQQKQTGDMIVTNYDAQQKVTEEIVDAVMKSVKEKSWQDKNKPTIN